MANFLSDSFEGTVGDDLQVYNPNWTRITGITGSTTIASRLAARGIGGFYRSDAMPPNADYSVSGDFFISQIVTGPNLGVLGRVSTTAATYYQANLTLGTGVRLARTINGSLTTIETFPYTAVAGANVNVRLVMEGSNVSVYVDDALAIGPLVDNLIPEPGYPGFRLLNSSGGQLQLDSIRADTLGADQVTTNAIWTESGEIHVSNAVVRVSIAAGWSEKSEVQQASLGASVLAVVSWLEASEQTSVTASVGNSISINASWDEGSESQIISGRVDIISTASWPEESEANYSQITVGSAVSASANWSEENEGNTSAIRSDVYITGGWVERADVFALKASSGDVQDDIDALLVPPRQTVVFEGARRVVAFEGSKRVVSFE